ncbi:6,7-dimethyl-8-ribityllumazine synthase [Pinisolibacter aquiterrae]|uniref:6,7-dimethyl-8-ribityllumazine synthase n=1 Tax=Pinisolibacter aquiterrae TaxID=2815579 RepID=UPI001C3CA7F0|nr:6,7-dimethyl-8-ribityllumazine synthase [Pinisolibacter aquiterrae]MBV5264133.1 6,7-dimethyl-8-ribityllumazine synthase [Pinisolibacter aquiterrae]MCC8233773.1 6,7-dimethyl-8-ribityllumazine synthase [Pinisolibacter aquiterrae]
MSTQRHYADFDPAEVAGASVLIVQGGFEPELAAALREGAIAVLDAAGVAHEVITVPGALEIPAAIAFALAAEEKRGRRWDGYVALGCVVRGATGHYEVVAGESNRALMDLAVTHRLAFGNGILTVENDEQAWERADRNRLDKGGAAAAAALAMIALARKFGL